MSLLQRISSSVARTDKLKYIPTNYDHIPFGKGIQIYNHPVILSAYNGQPIHYNRNVNKLSLYYEEWQTRPNDVFLISFPKCGQFFIKKACIEIIRESDKKEGFKSHDLYDSGDLGRKSVANFESLLSTNYEDIISKLDQTIDLNPCLWTSHLALGQFPLKNVDPNTKFIIVIRDPKATVVSHYYFFVNNGKDYNHTLELNLQTDENKFEFAGVLNNWLTGLTPHGCYFDYYLKWYEYYKNSNNILFVYYEDLKQDPVTQLHQIALFLGINNLNDDSLVNIANKISFDNVKKAVLSTSVSHAKSLKNTNIKSAFISFPFGICSILFVTYLLPLYFCY